MEISPPEEQDGIAVKEQHTAITTRIDLLTVAAIAVVTYLTGTIAHEALGHGLASLLVGLHPTRVTSVELAVSYTGVVAWKVRFVAAAGCTANVITALIALILQRTMRKMSAATHYYLWLLATLNLLAPGGYLLALTFAGFGDWYDFLQGMPNPLFWQIGLTLLGAIITLLGIYRGMRTMDPFLGADESQRMKRARSLILISYLAGCTVNTLAAVFNPTSPTLILTSAAGSSFGGTACILFIWRLVVKARASTAEVPITPTRDWVWIGLGCVALLVYFVVLGPGLPR